MFTGKPSFCFGNKTKQTLCELQGKIRKLMICHSQEINGKVTQEIMKKHEILIYGLAKLPPQTKKKAGQ